jgi:hypothetical protein
MKIEWGSQIRNYVMQPHKLVKDVRTGHETSNVDGVMNGEIDEFLKAYLMMMGQKKSNIYNKLLVEKYFKKLWIIRKPLTILNECVKRFSSLNKYIIRRIFYLSLVEL